MSERILKALMQLFAIVAGSEAESDSENSGRNVVAQFLHGILSKSLVQEYLTIFDDYSKVHHKRGKAKRKKMAVNSVKVLKICTQINAELTQRQKIIVLIWLLEFIYTDREASEQEVEFVDTVAETFNIDREEYHELRDFICNLNQDERSGQNLLTIGEELDNADPFVKHIYAKGVEGHVRVLRIASVNEYILRYNGKDNIYLNGQIVQRDKSSILSRGASIRASKMKPVYYSDIISRFMSDFNTSKVSFEAHDISYQFPNGNIGLQSINIFEDTGKMIGIMGGSGSGKSTLLNVLNGNYTPSTGSVKVNGIDIHREKEKMEGAIGYVAQDDLLIEELTVFQNLYYTGKLCFADLDEDELVALVEKTLADLGLLDKKDLKVGNPLEKTISGGQRKRLNIALELIREPTVLYVDEPTSGLSSRDSENIMDLLKELALKGKLIFVVIHQPSSDLFKMFDKLFFLDQGGYTAFYGNPIDSVTYFKKQAHFANSDEGDCFACGNVNPEDIFNIIESKLVDEYGNQTAIRKTSPEEWYETYKENIGNKLERQPAAGELPETPFKLPNLLNQFKVFITRDVLAKLTNRQYMLINLIEAPFLAGVLAFFLKYFIFRDDVTETGGYLFRYNENIPQFIFISVIVALFIGLTVSSEEIIRDKRIRARESFLNLSRSSYITSKIGVMFAMSAIQMLLFVIVGCWLLEIKGLTWYYWVGLFTTSCFANMLGLNISANFNSAKVIYILIPIMIIPQLLFSGVIVRFDKLHPLFASQKSVPFIGNVMASRWAYEGLAVAQFKENEYNKTFFHLDQRRKYANWKKDSWVKALSNKAGDVRRNLNNEEKAAITAHDLSVLKNELTKEAEYLKFTPSMTFSRLDELTPVSCTSELMDDVDTYLNSLIEHYRDHFNSADSEKENIIEEMTLTAEKKEEYFALLNDNSNESLEKFATNRNGLEIISEHGDELIQKKDLIYTQPFHSTFFESPFYSPEKRVFGGFMHTFWANMLLIWTMTLALATTLYTDIFKKIANLFSKSAK